MGRKEIGDKWEGLGKGARKPPLPTLVIFFVPPLLHATHCYLNLEQTWEMSVPFPLGRNTRPKWATYRSYRNTVLLSFFLFDSEKQNRCERCFTTKAPKVRLACFEYIFFCFFILNTILSLVEEAFLHRLGDELLLNFGAKYQRWFIVSRVKIQKLRWQLSIRLSAKLAANCTSRRILASWKIIRIWTKRAGSYSLISLVSIWLHILIRIIFCTAVLHNIPTYQGLK